ncbi:Cyclic di-GMP phosphodiesterase [subsurface metagenome]|nr:HD domain-containing protein [bacterium]
MGLMIQSRNGLSEAIRAKEAMSDMHEMKKIYEDAIVDLRNIMDDILEGKKITGRRVFSIAERIALHLRVEKNTLVSFINIFGFLGETDDYLYSHSINVAILSGGVGMALEYGDSKLLNLCVSSLLHDLGLLKIPENIIKKPGKLTKDEFAQVQKHTSYGLELLANISDMPESVQEVIYQHHERMDGTGYPEGKRGMDISESAKIVAIVEVYEAMTHPRPYRGEKIIPYDGVRQVVQDAKSVFDPRLVKKFLKFITPYPLGSFVLLNNNEIGRVVLTYEEQPLRPVVEIFFDSDGKPPEEPKRIDLSKSPVLHVEKAVDDSLL